MKVLILTNQVPKVPGGFMNVIQAFNNNSIEVAWAANFSNFQGKLEDIPCTYYDICIKSNPLRKENIQAYKEIIKIVKECNIEAIYCSTPIGGFLGRLVGKKLKIKVLYHVHGFHFYKGSFHKRWPFYLYEKIMEKYTDSIITINEEDFLAAKQMYKNKNTYKVHGVGINIPKIEYDPFYMESQFGISQGKFILTSAGELNKNKNNKIVLKALRKLNNKDIVYIICGKGVCENKLRKYVLKYNMENNVIFAGYRLDIAKILSCSNAFVMASYREGLPRACMEAMSVGLPCIVSNIRGLRDLIEQERGFLFSPNKCNELACSIQRCFDLSDVELDTIRLKNKDYVNNFNSKKVIGELTSIFKEEFLR